MSNSQNDMADFFSGKVQKIRSVFEVNRTTIDQYETLDSDDIDKLSTIKPVTEEELKLLILKTPSKSCQSDPVPTCLLKQCVDQLLPAIYKLLNLSLTSSTVLSSYKSAVISMLALNLLVVSKPLKEHRTNNNLDEVYQSAYHSNHATETAVL